MWETGIGTEPFPKYLLEKVRANLVTAFWYSSIIITNFPIKPSTKMSKDVKIFFLYSLLLFQVSIRSFYSIRKAKTVNC